MNSERATRMAREIAEMPEAVARLATAGARARSKGIARTLRDLSPKALVTVARGSSDHAATYLSYAIQSTLRIPVASVGPSIHSVHGTDLHMRGLAAIAISQSGSSEDITSLCRSFHRTGGHVISLTNTPDSPLAAASRQVIDISAGPERAVAATKSVLNAIVAGLWLLADWAEDPALAGALDKLPQMMTDHPQDPAFAQAEACLSDAQQAVIIARGAGLGIAGEFALKLLETCAMHASAYSGAEILHGPSALLRAGFPVIALTTSARNGMDQALRQLPKQGARVVTLPSRTSTGHPLVDPLLDLQPLYSLAESLSLSRGLDPDDPPHLNKITRTI